MSKTIYKYYLPIEDEPVIDMPVGAMVLSVREQGELANVWALVETDAEIESRQFFLAGTGRPVPFSEKGLRFIATFLMYEGTVVFHLFEMSP